MTGSFRVRAYDYEHRDTEFEHYASFPDLKIRRLSNHESPGTGSLPFLTACAKIVKARGFGGALRSRGARENADRADLTPRPQRWLQWGERPVADRGGVQSHNLHLESHDVAGVSALGRMTGKGRFPRSGKRAGRCGIVKGFGCRPVTKVVKPCGGPAFESLRRTNARGDVTIERRGRDAEAVRDWVTPMSGLASIAIHPPRRDPLQTR
jgi:hypothetical protein